jgi:hypothetical protein
MCFGLYMHQHVWNRIPSTPIFIIQGQHLRKSSDLCSGCQVLPTKDPFLTL